MAAENTYPTDKILQRITAKKALWIHLSNILPELRFANYGHSEMIDQVISDSLTYLHPHFIFLEIFNEVQTAAITFMLPQPAKLETTFTKAYYQHVRNKLKRNG